MKHNSFYNSNYESPEESLQDVIFSGSQKQLILFNDEVNSFDFIIDSLIDICEHSPEQAEQCAMIAHFKGKCVIKEGPQEILQKMAQQLTSKQITVEIN